MMRYRNILPLVITLLSMNFAFCADAPVYKDGVLTIPSVNTADEVGKYQDVIFKLNEQGLWQLSSFKGIGIVIMESDLRLVPIIKVEVVKTGTFPDQVFLRVTGGLGGCYSLTLEQINQRQEGNRFDVAIATSHYVNPYYPTLCPMVSGSFVKTIPLAIYGLSADSYSYNVNGTTGTFELTVNNKYPGDY